MNFTFKLARRLALSHILAIATVGLFAGSCAPGQPLDAGLEPPPDDVLAIHLVPDSVSLNPNEFVDFTAIAEINGGGNGKVPVDWEATGGTITADGRYTAGTTSGTYKVKGRYRNGKLDSAIVAISPPPPGPVLARIDVTPISAALQPGATQQFSATGAMSDGSSTAVTVTWAATGGTVTSSGFYTAPSGAGTYLVIATEQTGTLADTAQVTVGTPPPTLSAVILTPGTASLQFGRTQQFSAVGQLSDGSSTSIAITWSATGGTVNASGLYTAGNTAGTFRVIARSANGLADTSAVTVTAPTITSISLTPATVSLQSGQTQQFSVSAALSNGGTQTNPAVTWNATGGAINSTGLYTAGATAGSFRVIATSTNGRADTSAVTISTPTVTAITVTPASASLTPAQTQQFAASATLSNGTTQVNPTVTWSATGGTISTGGLYTAGSTAGSFRVIAASTNGRADTSAVTITAATIVSVTLTPATVSLQSGQTQQFSVSAALSDGTTQTNPSVTYTATGGTITGAGLFTAGSTAGSFRVIAAASGKADTSAVTITAPTITAISLTPATANLQTGQTQQYSVSATLSNGGTQNNPSVTYSVTGGTITAGGLYTAGSAAGGFQVVATAAGGAADTSAVTIAAATITAITLTPASVSVGVGNTQQFTASATLSNGGTQNNPSVTYSVTGGTITSGGLYTAGGTAGSFQIIATATGGAADTSAVTITAATITAIVVTPGSASVGVGNTQQFTASATLSNGGTQANPSVTWSATGGTISTSGAYTAGATAGSFRVIATQQGGTLADSSAVTVTVTAPPTLTQVILTPATVTLATGATQQFAVSGRMSDGSSSTVTVTYTATGGTITSGGLYTAGSATGSFQVIATQQGGTLADTSAVTITGGGGGGTVLFSEAFANNNLASRGWYDGGAPPVVTYLGRQAAQYTFSVGQTNPGGLLSMRHTFTPTTNVYLEAYVAFAANWVGSGKPYHPHIFNLMSNYDNALNGGYVSPADSYLNFYAELNHVSGQGERLYQAIQDNRYVNPSYIYPANAPGENRSVSGANGPRQGDAQQWDAYADGQLTTGWYSARSLWGSVVVNPATDQGWHKYAVYLQQNTVVAGIGQVDGLLSVYWDDVLQYTRVVMTRTGQASPNNRAAIQFQQFLMGPYIGDGSPANQTMYISGVTIKDAP
jgi:hypothetical protein